MKAGKLTFQEAWQSASVFFVDDQLEDEIDAKVMHLLALAEEVQISDSADFTVDDVVSFIHEKDNDISGLNVILKDIGLSDEKFMRIVSLLRKIGRVPGGFESEWSINKIKRELADDPAFNRQIAQLLYDGKNDSALAAYIPRYYLDKLNYREIGKMPHSARELFYKNSLIGTYGSKKGHRVEAVISDLLLEIEAKHGIGYEKGRTRLVHVDVDFAIPSLDDPQVIVMSSFQETTSSGQTTKARDMFNAYSRVISSNSRYGEDRVFVNFVDGGGWLARKRDFQRLVEQCHYFINLSYLKMLESIILDHVLL